MNPPELKPTVKLTGEDGNAFAILGRVTRALKQAGADKEYIDQYFNDAIAGDYDQLLITTMEYVDVV